MNRVPRIFTHPLPNPLSQNLIEGDAAHYLIRVLRVKVGQSIELFDGQGQRMSAEVAQMDRREVRLNCSEIQAVDNRSPIHTTLCLALIKPERFEWALQKACELGVDSIQPLICDRSDGRLTDKLDKKMSRWQAILNAACEQSQRSHLPTLADPITLAELVPAGRGWVLDPTATAGMTPTDQPTQLLVGPEGGWSPAELELISQKGFTGIRMGPRVMRAETAAVAALSLSQYLSGDLAG